MTPTLDYIRQKFNEFNRLCFKGELPDVPIRLSNARTFLGQLAYKKRRTWTGKIEYYDYVLKISTRVDMPEREVEDTILHEMIHYYIKVNNIKDSSTHGRVFRQIMNSINSRFGRNITVSYKLSEDQKKQAVDKRPKWHVLAIARFNDGRTGIKILPKYQDRIENFKQKVFLIPGVSSVEFFFTHDPFYNRYPVSSAIKLHIISEDELNAHLPPEKNKINI